MSLLGAPTKVKPVYDAPEGGTPRRAGGGSDHASLSDRALLVPLVAGHTTIESAVESIISQGPVDHTPGVPDLVSLLQETEIVDVLNVRIDGVDVFVVGELVHDSHQHEDLVALTAPVEEALAATEPERHMLTVSDTSAAADHALGMDGRDEHRIFDGAERPNERRRLQVFIQLDDAKNVLSTFVLDGETHVAAELMVILLGQILRVHNSALCADSPVPIGVDEAQAVWITGHEGLHILGHGLGVQLEVLRKHTPPVAVATARLELACRCSWQCLPKRRAPGSRGDSF